MIQVDGIPVVMVWCYMFKCKYNNDDGYCKKSPVKIDGNGKCEDDTV